MDNITHTLVGVTLGQMGLKRQSRFAMAACVLGANAPDIDVFAPLFMPVDGIQFHRGPIHSVFAWPVLAVGIVAILWLVDRFRSAPEGAVPFRAIPLFGVALIGVFSHLFLDWLTTYAIALFAPFSWHWYSGNAIFIVDWVYWLLMAVGITVSVRRWRRDAPNPGRPAQIAGALMLTYIAFNLGESERVQDATAAVLRGRGIQAELVVPSPPPFEFWKRRIAWRSADRYGYGRFDLAGGLVIDPGSEAIGLSDPRFISAYREQRRVRSFFNWSRMPIVVEEQGRAYLGDQRYSGFGRSNFLVPLDSGAKAK
jgi:inner membrane protein